MVDRRGARLGRVYEVRRAGGGEVRLELAETTLPELEVSAGWLVGASVSVETRCVLVTAGLDGELRGEPIDDIALRDGGLCFGPGGGGVRSRENRLAAGALNSTVAEAARFGMVNTFFHLTGAASYFDGLLAEVGAERLPPLHAVVSAHSGSQLPGYGHADGDFRQGGQRPLPFQGGHYRLSRLTTGVPELDHVRATGEVHLGPGRHREPFAGQASYLRNAAHNPATIYHEAGHHLCRHTADFRLNAERDPGAQRNGKTGPEEGVCDYLTASLLGTGRPYGWYRSTRGQRRDPAIARDGDRARDSDPHAVGARWASVFWRARTALLERELVTSPRDHDRAVVAALLAVGSVARPPSARPRRVRAAERSSAEAVAQAYVEAIRLQLGAPAAGVAAGLLDRAGLVLGGAAAAVDCPAC